MYVVLPNGFNFRPIYFRPMMIQKALQIATQAHEQQRDRYGKPYLLHVIRVMQRGRSEAEQICGVLHDVVEDTDWTFEQLLAAGFPADIVDTLRCLTKGEDELYQHYIDRVKTNQLAIAVKLNDLEDNMDLRRVDVLLPKDLDRLNKYLRAYQELVEPHPKASPSSPLSKREGE